MAFGHPLRNILDSCHTLPAVRVGERQGSMTTKNRTKPKGKGELESPECRSFVPDSTSPSLNCKRCGESQEAHWKREAHKLSTIITLSLVGAALLYWFTLHVATTIARAQINKIEHTQKETSHENQTTKK
jgi:hypothetical protein